MEMTGNTILITGGTASVALSPSNCAGAAIG